MTGLTLILAIIYGSAFLYFTKELCIKNNRVKDVALMFALLSGAVTLLMIVVG